MNDVPFHVRLTTEDDLTAITVIEAESFPSLWSIDIFRKEMRLSFCRTFVAMEKESVSGTPVGYIFFWIIGHEMQLHSLAVKKSHRKQGIGSLLIKEMIKTCRAEGVTEGSLEVRASNRNAIDLYQKAGFTTEGVRRGYYGDIHEDALIMCCTIGQI